MVPADLSLVEPHAVHRTPPYCAPVNGELDGPAIRYRRDGPAAYVTLGRPARHNALGAEDVDALSRVLDEVRRDGVRVLVLTGEGDRTFCSGASLEEMEGGRMSGAIFDTLTDSLAALPLPTVARINGSVYGGGAELALCCDFRVGVRGMRLSVPAAKLGVCYPPGGLRRYVTRLGLGAASRILLAAEELDADELLGIGYLTHLVEPTGLDHEVAALVDRLTGLAPLAVRNMKRGLLGLAQGDTDPADLSRLVAECSSSDDMKEGLRAWRERRTPEFKGR